MGPLGYVFNTPSHHRVHHGRNPYCIDKNFGGVFIIWDRVREFVATRPLYEIDIVSVGLDKLWMKACNNA